MPYEEAATKPVMQQLLSLWKIADIPPSPHRYVTIIRGERGISEVVHTSVY